MNWGGETCPQTEHLLMVSSIQRGQGKQCFYCFLLPECMYWDAATLHWHQPPAFTTCHCEVSTDSSRRSFGPSTPCWFYRDIHFHRVSHYQVLCLSIKQTAIVGLPRPYFISQSNKPLICSVVSFKQLILYCLICFFIQSNVWFIILNCLSPAYFISRMSTFFPLQQTILHKQLEGVETSKAYNYHSSHI